MADADKATGDRQREFWVVWTPWREGRVWESKMYDSESYAIGAAEELSGANGHEYYVLRAIAVSCRRTVTTTRLAT